MRWLNSSYLLLSFFFCISLKSSENLDHQAELNVLINHLESLKQRYKKITALMKALNFKSEEDLLEPAPLVIQCNVSLQDLEERAKKIREQIKFTSRYVKALKLRGTQNLAELLEWYYLLPGVLQDIVRDYYNVTSAEVCDYNTQAWWHWKSSYKKYNIGPPERFPLYSLNQQVFLMAFFNEYDRGECTIPDRHMADLYYIYSSFCENDKELMQCLKRDLVPVHSCDPDVTLCLNHVQNTHHRTIIRDITYNASNPRVMHINDEGDVLLLSMGNLLRNVLKVRKRNGEQHHLYTVGPRESLYGALWCNNGKHIVSVKKVIVPEDKELKENSADEPKDNSPEVQDLDVGGKSVAVKGSLLCLSRQDSLSTASTNSSSYGAFTHFLLTIWSWPDRVKCEEAIVVSNLDDFSYDEYLDEQHNILHNYMFACYYPERRDITFIIPPYKRKLYYSFVSGTKSSEFIDILCENVVMSNSLKFAICPKGENIQFGRTDVENSSTFSWWERLRWQTYHTSKQLRAYNVDDDGHIVGITSDGRILNLPSGGDVVSIEDHAPRMRDDWPVIFSPGNKFMMIPLWEKRVFPRKSYSPDMLNTRWLLVKIPQCESVGVSSMHHLPSGTFAGSVNHSCASSSSSMASSAVSSSSQMPRDCCLTM